MVTSYNIDYNLSVPIRSTRNIYSVWIPVVSNNDYQNSLKKNINSIPILDNYYVIRVQKLTLKMGYYYIIRI